MDFIRAKKVGLGLDMAPLIDCVFQLLIFFMLSSSFLSPALKLTLPKASIEDDIPKERIVISADQAGSIFVNNQKVSMKSLKPAVESKLAGSDDKSVHFRGDEKIPYHLFVEVMDSARQAGASQINIIHDGQKK